MISYYAIFILALLAANCDTVKGGNNSSQRNEKALSLFNIVRFSNSPCPGSGNRNGTCYTEAECKTKNGVAAGTCASGYGVCCTFSATCGQTSNENCTYFESSSVPTGACRLQICKCNENVCQLRLDFNSFVIAGPTTATDTVAKILNGVVSLAGKVKVTQSTQCLTDRFSVTSPGSPSPPTICGTNTGEHMYVDASNECNELAFQLGSSSSVNRQWSIKITQYSCDFDNLAPSGCTQYYFGTGSGLVKSYNFDGGAHLANQEQKICIRQERGNCQVCYFPTADADFVVSADTVPTADMPKGFTGPSKCCGYGTDGKGVNGYDCVVIPGAQKQSADEKPVPGTQICGRAFVTVDSMPTTMVKTICTEQRPFRITFRSDNYESEAEASKKPNEGFRLAFEQKSC